MFKSSIQEPKSTSVFVKILEDLQTFVKNNRSDTLREVGKSFRVEKVMYIIHLATQKVGIKNQQNKNL